MPRSREDNESVSSVERSDEEYEEDDDDSYSESEEDDDDGSGRTLLFLCEEGQLDIALKRVQEWDNRLFVDPSQEEESTDTAASNSEETAAAAAAAAAAEEQMAMIRIELFRKNPTTGNTCLHEILAGGTSGKSAPELVKRLVRLYTTICGDSNNHTKLLARSRSVFLGQPLGSSGRTPLHWCAWSKTDPQLLKLVLNACPDALVLRDDKSLAQRTPFEIAQRYWPNDTITSVLKAAQARYLPYRVRICVTLCVQRLFLTPTTDNNKSDKNNQKPEQKPSPKSKHQTTSAAGKPNRAKRKRLNKAVSQTKAPYSNSVATTVSYLKPFDKKDRKIAGLTPRRWFVASVLGYAYQREMKGLALRILSYVGCRAKLTPPKRWKWQRATQTKRISATARKPTKTVAAAPAATSAHNTNRAIAENTRASDNSSSATTKPVTRNKRKRKSK